MSYLHYSRSRSRERSLFDDSDSFFSRPLVRRNTKRARVITLSDNEDNTNGPDDYPYSPTHQPSHFSRALTLRREPSQLEKYNVWSYEKPHHHHHDSDTELHRRRHYHYTTTKHYDHAPQQHSDSDRDEREFRLKVRATFSKPSSSSHSSSSTSYWPGTLFRRREKLTNVDWETHERSRSRSRSREPSFHHHHRGRRDSLFDDDEHEDDVFKEKSVRYRKVKRTRTDEFKPLSGFRRY